MPTVGRRARWICAASVVVVLLAGGRVMQTWAPRVFFGPLATGLAAYDRGNWSAAAEHARRRLSANSDDPDALGLLARASAHLGRDQAATTLYRKLMASNSKPLSAEDDYLLGRALHRQHKTDDAVASWEAGLKLDPARGEILDALARAYIEQSRFTEAETAAARLALQPAWATHAGLMLGEIRTNLNDPAGAVEALDAAMRDADKLRAATKAPSLFHKLLARNLLHLGRPAPAQGQLQTVLETGPDTESSWLLSRAHLQQGAIAAAANALGQARSYRAEHPLESEPGSFVGEAGCAECHQEIDETARRSRHAQSLYRGAQLKELPLPDQPLPDPSNPGITHAIIREGDRLQAETRTEGRLYRAVIDYAFGTSDRYVTMVGRDGQGEFRAVRFSYYHGPEGAGWDVSAGDTALPTGELGFLGRPVEARAGVVRCLYCHATNVRGGTERTGPETADRAIGCERCHGPGGNHLSAVAGQFADMAIAASPSAPAKELTKLCNQCHTLHSPEVELEVPRTDPIWHRSPGVSFTWSKCSVASGEAFNCLTCHDPHRPAETSAAYYEAKCLACHIKGSSTPAAGRARRTSLERQADSQASLCPVNPTDNCLTCHMPRVRNEILHIPLTDHYIRIRRDAPSPSPQPLPNKRRTP